MQSFIGEPVNQLLVPYCVFIVSDMMINKSPKVYSRPERNTPLLTAISYDNDKSKQTWILLLSVEILKCLNNLKN